MGCFKRSGGADSRLVITGICQWEVHIGTFFTGEWDKVFFIGTKQREMIGLEQSKLPHREGFKSVIVAWVEIGG